MVSCAVKRVNPGEQIFRESSKNESENRKESLVAHEELLWCCVVVEYAAVVSWRENDLKVAQRHEFCLCKLARARVEACWRPGRDSIVANGMAD